MSRRIITKATIDELLIQGDVCQLAAGDIVTALAKEYAQERGLRLVPASSASSDRSARHDVAEPDDPAAEVRRRIVAALGYEPEGLDRAIQRGFE